MHKESFQLSRLLDQDAPQAPSEDVLVAKCKYAGHVQQVEHLQMLVKLFVHVFGGVVERCCLKRLASRRDQVKDCVRGQLEARAYLLLCRRMELDCFLLVPTHDHLGQSLQALSMGNSSGDSSINSLRK